MPAPDDPTKTPMPPSARAAPAGPWTRAVDAAILNAAWRLLLEEGYSRLSIAGIAQAAKVGRPAIYRRYKDKSELVAAVIADKVANVPPIDTGNARDDLIAHLELARKRFTVSLAGTLIVEERNHPELLEQFRQEMIVPRRDSIAEALERGQGARRGPRRPRHPDRLARPDGQLHLLLPRRGPPSEGVERAGRGHALAGVRGLTFAA